MPASAVRPSADVDQPGVSTVHCLESGTLHRIFCFHAAAGSRDALLRLMLVCRAWSFVAQGCPWLHAVVLVSAHGPEEALVRAAQHGRDRIVQSILALGEKAPRANCLDGEALVCAARGGHVATLRALLGYKKHAPRGDHHDGLALIMAAQGGHEAAARLLLGLKEHAPRADCQDGLALIKAAGGGHEAVILLLLGRKNNTPRADCQDGLALLEAARGGHVGAMRLLLSFAVHAPRADCQNGLALLRAAQEGHEAAAQLLLHWGQHPPEADCRNGKPLLMAAKGGHTAVVQLLLDFKQHEPRRAQAALTKAARGGHTDTVNLLLARLEKADNSRLIFPREVAWGCIAVATSLLAAGGLASLLPGAAFVAWGVLGVLTVGLGGTDQILAVRGLLVSLALLVFCLHFFAGFAGVRSWPMFAMHLTILYEELDGRRLEGFWWVLYGKASRGDLAWLVAYWGVACVVFVYWMAAMPLVSQVWFLTLSVLRLVYARLVELS